MIITSNNTINIQEYYFIINRENKNNKSRKILSIPKLFLKIYDDKRKEIVVKLIIKITTIYDFEER